MATDYDWHPDANNGGSVFKVETHNLKWWVVLAIVVSVLIHILMYFVLTRWEGPASAAQEDLNFRLLTEQESIDRDTLEELLADEPVLPEDLDVKTIEPENLSDIDIDQNFDEFGVMDELSKEELIRMAPADAPEMFGGAMPQVPSNVLDMAATEMDLASADTLNNELQDMRKKLTEASEQISPDQVTLEIDANEVSEGLNTDEFFKDAAQKVMGEKADEFVKGYATLDDLIGMTGGIKRGTSKTAMMPTDILFDYGEDSLKESAELAMIKLAYLIETNPDAVFIIEGHTDSFGGDEYNRALSERRAQAVKDWLVKKLRLDAKNIRVVGKGKLEPIVPITGDADQQELNRRVEIEIRRD